jgi:hypothetical protein
MSALTAGRPSTTTSNTVVPALTPISILFRRAVSITSDSEVRLCP